MIEFPAVAQAAFKFVAVLTVALRTHTPIRQQPIIHFM